MWRNSSFLKLFLLWDHEDLFFFPSTHKSHWSQIILRLEWGWASLTCSVQMWEQNWKTRFCLASKGQLLLPEVWVHSTMVHLVAEHPAWTGQVLSSDEWLSRSQKVSLLEDFFGILWSSSEIKPLSVAFLMLSCKISVANSGSKAYHKMCVFSHKARSSDFRPRFSSVIGLTGTSCASTSSGIPLPSLTVKAQTNK